MKVYYLHLTKSDFTVNGNVYLTDAIDLYDNNSYRNYSSVKSNYGLNSLGDNTWTGLSKASPDWFTDSGELTDSNTRFIDHTGRIDLMSQGIEFAGQVGTAEISVTTHVYNTDDATLEFSNQWSQKRDMTIPAPIIWVGVQRYIRFELIIQTAADLTDADFEYLVRVEIDRPVMNPLYQRTRTVINKFPQWMSLSNDALEPATPFNATPNTLGGKLINAVAGEWLTLLNDDIGYTRMQQYINTADLNLVSSVYFAAQVPQEVWSAIGDGVALCNTAILTDFYDADLDDNVYWWDEYRECLYVRKEYDTLQINGQEYELEFQQVWNWFDEHGAILDLMRLRGESNYSYQQRILDIYINKPGISMDKFKNALRRELDLWKAFAATPEQSTPDSSVGGATPTVLEMEDIEGLLEFVGPDGMPTPKFVDLVNYLAETYPVTWGYFKYNFSVWDVAGFEDNGFGILPYQFDATPPEHLQPGIGDGADLFVYRPDDITGPREFSYRLKVRGRQRSTRTEYPEIVINAEVYGTASKKIYNNVLQQPWITYVVATPSHTYYLPIHASVVSDVNTDVPTPTSNSYAYYDILGPDGKTKLEHTWYDELGHAYAGNAATPFYMDMVLATSSYLQWGRFNPVTLTFTDYPANGSVTAWFSNTNGASPNVLIANNSNTHLNPTNIHIPGNIVMVSNITNFVVGTWESPRQPIIVKVNGDLPSKTQKTFTMALPVIEWDPNLEAVPNKKYIINITGLNSSGQPTVITRDNQDQQIYLSPNIITVSGNNTWTGGKLTFNSGSVTQFVFSAGSSVSPAYPLTQQSYWTNFEANEQNVRYGVVDENGPWREGRPQEPGGFNFLMEQADVNRADFGLSNSVNYVITWIGVEVLDNNRVTAWLDSNVVNPATDDDTIVSYPNNAVVEEYDNSISNYIFSPFFIRGRMRPDIDPQWFPQVHSGWFYQQDKEYYLYASPVTELSPSTPFFTLADVARQGAPIILKTNQSTPVEYRQVSFFDEATPVLSLTNTETVYGSGTGILYVAYKDIYDISIVGLDSGQTIPAVTYSDTNQITTSIVTAKDTQYEVTYKVNKSFIADHDYVTSNNRNTTKIDIAERVSYPGNYRVDYEGSNYDPATPIDLPLNTFYTVMDEGFIFLSHNEYDLKYVEVKLSPSKVLADGEDYILASIFSYDENGNPKPNQTFDLFTSFGEFEATNLNAQTITTNEDGFTTAIIISANSTNTLTGYLQVDGPGMTDATVNYEIDEVDPRKYRLVALPSADSVPADGVSKIIVYGKVEDDNFKPVPYAAVAWKRNRNMPALFQMAYQGQVVADDLGRFAIPALTAATPWDPGYWFMELESWNQGASPAGPVATPNYSATPYISPQYGPIGDVVFWNEYPDHKYGVNNINLLPIMPLQQNVNPIETVYYSHEVAFPVTPNPATPTVPAINPATPPILVYDPPEWYACDRYTQYQLGLLGTIIYKITLALIRASRPFWKDL